MKKLIYKIFVLIFILGLLPFNFSSAEGTATRLKGRILLQVESNGEAWYVNPENEKRYFLGRPTNAFQVMRDLGLGISNKDFDIFNGKAPNRLSGKILLKVEDNGKAYYVNPVDLKLHFLGKPDDAFQVMRRLGLGIKNNDLFFIPTSDSYLMNFTNKKSKLTKETAYKAITRITCVNQNLDMIQGSGVIVSPDGKILTNAHVTTDIEEDYIGRWDCEGCIPTKNDSYTPDYCFNLNMFQKNTTNDLALGIIQNKFNYQRYILIKNVKEMSEYPFLNINLNKKIGDAITAIGYPSIADGIENITKGNITSKTKIKNYDFFVSDVNVSYGNSGGAIINESGELLGLATQVSSDELMSLTYILDLNSLKTEYNFYKKARLIMPFENAVNIDRSIYFLEDIFTINKVVY